jgi:hypothetical protein
VFESGEIARFDSAETPAGERVRRFDAHKLDPPVVTKHGFLLADSFIARAGVQSYTQADGSVRHELRPPNEVFSPKSLASFALMPVTIDHPATEDGLLRATDAHKYQVGACGEPRQDGDHVRSKLMLTSERAIKAARAGMHQTSCAYETVVVNRPGEYVAKDGTVTRYDAIQTEIVGNHVALCIEGRAGSTALRLDSTSSASENHPALVRADAPAPNKAAPTGVTTVKIKIGETEYDVPDGAASAFTETCKRLDSTTAQLAAEKTEREKLAGKVAALEIEAKNRTDAEQAKARTDAQNAATVDRSELVMRGAKVLKKPISEVVKLDDASIIAEALKVVAPETKLDGKEAAYKRALFDHLTAKFVDTPGQLADIVEDSTRVDAKTANETDLEKRAEAARDKMIAEQAEAWKRPTAAAR